ncbi:hypothetical protein ACOJVU_09060 [Mycobacterium sp. THU-M104]|uniref:hypothetical protein n=1 Tax=Mycobacterium sp. THU-M104 TaxID=3410515 RepID=UPI003B9A6656
MSLIPQLYRGLCDDAALFPPGNAPLSQALTNHFRYRAGDFADLIGNFICPAARLDDLRPLLSQATAKLEVSLTFPDGLSGLTQALAGAANIDTALVRGIEIALPAVAKPRTFFADLAATGVAATVDVYVEVPRDDRQQAVLDGIAQAGLRAKFRTGGVRADLYPNEHELAGFLLRARERDVAFKATAGLHHAVRNTDPATGFEQHGYLNLMLAAAAPADEMETLLALRDPLTITQRIGDLDPSVRSRFISFGTCSINEPLTELIDLGLLPASVTQGTRT